MKVISSGHETSVRCLPQHRGGAQVQLSSIPSRQGAWNLNTTSFTLGTFLGMRGSLRGSRGVIFQGEYIYISSSKWGEAWEIPKELTYLSVLQIPLIKQTTMWFRVAKEDYRILPFTPLLFTYFVGTFWRGDLATPTLFHWNRPTGSIKPDS